MSDRVSNIADFISNVSKILIAALGIVALIYSVWYVQSKKYLEDGDKANGVFEVVKHFYGVDMHKDAEVTIEEQIKRLNATVVQIQEKLQVSDEEANRSDEYQTPEQTELTREIQETEKVFRRLNGSPSKASKWVYAGAMDNETGNWKTKYFGFSALEVGSEYTVSQAINVRATPPSKESGTWQKGKVTGGLLAGDRFRVKSIQEVPGTNNRTLFWVEIDTL
ncbi:MAG: hypothetical protein IKR72_05825 [Bacteroidales bacterium]|nr:hypothetical protein [Bacteroidales bacterium]